MADELPEPASRKEQYLAKAAGMDVDELPEPASREEQYLNAIAEGGGGGGGGVTPVQTTGTSTTDVMSQNATSSMVFADPGTDSKIKIGLDAIANSDMSVVVGRSSRDSGSYYNTIVGSNGIVAAGRNACVGIGFQTNVNADNSVAIGRAAKISQTSRQSSVALGAWAEPTRKGEVNVGTGGNNQGYNSTDYRVIGGVHDPVDAHDAATKGYVDSQGGGGDTIYSDKSTSDNTTGGAVYIGNLNSSQEEQADPTVTDYHFKYFWALPYSNTNIPNDKTINILGTNAAGNWAVAIGDQCNITAGSDYGVAIGYSARVEANGGIAIGGGASVASNLRNSIALGARSNPTRSGEVNVGNTWGAGYNNTNYRLIGGVHDGVDAHDAVTVGQLNTRMGGMTILSITQAAYDALATKDPNTLYVITGA